MGVAGEEAAAVVAQFARDGFVAEESRERAEFGVWDRVTPGRVVLVALQTVLRLRHEDGQPAPGLLVEGVRSPDGAQGRQRVRRA
ncbi:hypothetical protein, partial [Streptomyces zhihengii]